MVYCRKVKCQYCGRKIDIRQLNKHETKCLLNPKNIKYCPVCSKAITSIYKTKTCSHACANTYFRSGPDHPNWSDACYTTTCFHYHKHECIICGETNIVEAHHFDGNKNNNKPNNFVPLCPTHHKYMHSRFRELIDKKVIKYKKDFEKSRSVAQG